MIPTHSPIAKPAERELALIRVFDAPRELVFKAWTDPKHLARWWGPHGFTNPVCEVDARPGGAMVIQMRGPDGTLYPMRAIFREVVAPERLVFAGSAFDGELETLTTVTFEALGRQTRLSLRVVVLKATPAVALPLAGMETGWNESLDRLAGELGESTVNTVTSKDGTTIAFDRLGQGPAVILVSGALGLRTHPVMTGLAERLAPHFTVFNYDRRGRGGSGDTQPYAVAREVEDIEALIGAGGGSACLYGLSSGAVLALEAASRLPGKVSKVALYDPPFIVDDTFPPLPSDYLPHLAALRAAGRRGEAVEYFFGAAMRLPAEYLAMMKADPSWALMEAVAPTLGYDGAIMGDTMSGRPLRTERWATDTAPSLAMLVINGSLSPEFMHHGAQALVAGLPRAERKILEGQSHGPAPEVLAPLLLEFFKGETHD